MNQQFKISKQSHHYCLSSTLNVSVLTLPKKMSAVYQQIMAYLESHNIQPEHPPFAHFMNIDFEDLAIEKWYVSLLKLFSRKWRVQIGFITPHELNDHNSLKAGEIEPFTCIEAIHKGPYEKVSDTYKKIVIWARENNYSLKNESWELYLNDPRVTSRKDLETTILVPIIT